MAGRAITRGKRAAAAAMIQAGASVRETAREIGISKSSAAMAVYDPTLDQAEVDRVKDKIQGRMIVASDRFLTRSLDGIQDLHPYQAMLCAGIAHDHYLRSRAAGQSTGQQGSVTNILIQIDKSLRVQANKVAGDTDR